ncbi:hypothetical protein ACVMII_001314 [Bradyrhizobium diazoefficiens]
MAIYYFDLRDGDEIVPDEEGLELRDLLAVQEEAARALAPAGHFKFLRVWSVKFLHPRGRTRDC